MLPQMRQIQRFEVEGDVDGHAAQCEADGVDVKGIGTEERVLAEVG